MKELWVRVRVKVDNVIQDHSFERGSGLSDEGVSLKEVMVKVGLKVGSIIQIISFREAVDCPMRV